MRFFIACLMSLSVTAASARTPATDISGTWTFSVQLPQEVAHSTFVFRQEGEKLTGSYSGPLGPASVAGTVKGDQAVFGFTGKNNQGEPITVDYIGKIVSAARMTGTVDFHKGPPLEFTATKNANKK